MEGFFRRIWKNKNVDKVALIRKGVFLVRFQTMDSMGEVLEGHYFFDKKPIILKAWSPDVDFAKEDIKTLPVWVQLQLALKYWGETSLHKIVAQIGDPIKRDEATRNREKLQYARILVEIKIDQDLPEVIFFINEHGDKINVPVHYEWSPIRCGNCQNFGHEDKICKMKKSKKM